MRRRTGHLAFAAAAVLCAAAIAVQGLRLQRILAINRAMADADRWAVHTPSPATASSSAAQSGVAPSPKPAPPLIDTPSVDRHVALARAVALTRAGNTEAALRSFNALAAPGLSDDVARAALFDSGNLYLREGLRASGNPAVFLPLMELAKQRYRDLLRADPSDWDARFNLERALRAAPEEVEEFEQPDERPVDRPPNKLPELLAPDLP